MTVKDQAKLLNAGFTILRKRDFTRMNKPVKFEIFQKTPERREWHTREWLFTGITHRNERLRELLKDSMIIED